MPKRNHLVKRQLCSVISRSGLRCDFAVHPGNVHWTWENGWPRPWMALPETDEKWINRLSTDGLLEGAPRPLRSVRDEESVAQHIQRARRTR